jgi:hypothetical protein
VITSILQLNSRRRRQTEEEKGQNAAARRQRRFMAKSFGRETFLPPSSNSTRIRRKFCLSGFYDLSFHGQDSIVGAARKIPPHTFYEWKLFQWWIK